MVRSVSRSNCVFAVLYAAGQSIGEYIVARISVLVSCAKVLSLSRSATAACGAQHIHCDLNSHSSITEAADAVSAVYGRSPTPVTLTLNAGHGKSDSARSVTQESLMQHLNINVVSQVSTQAARRSYLDFLRFICLLVLYLCHSYSGAVHIHSASFAAAGANFQHHLDRIYFVR